MDNCEKTVDVGSPEYWDSRYANGETGWDMKRETEVFRALRTRGEFPVAPFVGTRATKLFIPGCGYGHDALAFAQAGYNVTAVDFARAPLDVLAARATSTGVSLICKQLDVFALPRDFEQAFDAVLEYTCYCAIAPEQRAQYICALADALVPGGWLVGLFFPTDGRAGGPPFAVECEEVQMLCRAAGLVETSCVVPSDSHPARYGKEMLMVFQRSL